MNYKGCTTVENGSKIVVQDNRSSFALINKNKIEVEKIQIDGCLITGEAERCDWLLVAKCSEGEIAYFVELKGSDLDKAISQLGNTLKATQNRYKSAQRKCYAVTTRVPKYGPSVQMLVSEFYKKYAVLLIVKNIRASEEVICKQSAISDT